MTHIRALRPMGLMEIIDQTFRLYRANFWLFFAIAAVLYVPLGMLQQVPNLLMSGMIGTGMEPDSLEAFLPLFGVLFVLVAVLLIVWLVVTAALTKAVSDRYMGEPATVGGAYLHVAKRIFPLGVTFLISGVLIYLGSILMLVPGLILFFWVVPFVVQVIVIEDKGYFAAMWRSKFLVGQGVWAEWLVLFIMIGIIQYLIQLVGMVPLFVLRATAGPQSSVAWIAGGVIAGIAQAAALPIIIVACILLYYDSRIRKEGFDLEVLARELGKQLPPAPPPGPVPQPAQPVVSPASQEPPPAPGSVPEPSSESPQVPAQSPPPPEPPESAPTPLPEAPPPQPDQGGV